MILYRTVRFYGIYVQYNKLKITQVSVLDSLQLEVDDLLEDHLRQGAGLEVSVLDSLVLEVDDLLKDHLRQGAGWQVVNFNLKSTCLQRTWPNQFYIQR